MPNIQNRPSVKVVHDLGNKQITESTIKQAFARLGSHIVSYDGDGKMRRSAGVSFQEIGLTFADGQQVTLRIKQSGDVYQALLNGKAIPLRSIDSDYLKAIEEIDGMMNKGRAAFQKKLAKAAVPIPKGITATTPKMEQRLTEKRDALKEAIVAVQAEIAEIEKAAV